MGQGSIFERLFAAGSVVPGVRTFSDFKWALAQTAVPGIILLFGDIIVLPELLAEAKKYHKRILIHLDLLGGIGKDKAGIKFLARMGVTGALTTKPQLVKHAREEGMIVIQRLFLMDSEALKSGINLLQGCKPDAVEILPASVPVQAIQELSQRTGVPILAGGLLYTAEDVQKALQKGVYAVSTSRRELWK